MNLHRERDRYGWLLGTALIVIGLLIGSAASYSRLDGRVVRNTTLIKVQQGKLEEISDQLDEINRSILELSKGVAVLRESR